MDTDGNIPNRIEAAFGRIGWKPVFKRFTGDPDGGPGTGYLIYSPDSRYCIVTGNRWSTAAEADEEAVVAERAEADLLVPFGDTRVANWWFSEDGFEVSGMFRDLHRGTNITKEFIPEGGFSSLEEITFRLAAMGLSAEQEVCR